MFILDAKKETSEHRIHLSNSAYSYPNALALRILSSIPFFSYPYHDICIQNIIYLT